MYDLISTNNFLVNNARFYNKGKTDPAAKTAICVISKVNEKRLTVDVMLPSTSSQLSNVTIATNLISENGTGLLILPTEGQKGVLLMSSQHPAILIATLPNAASADRESTLLYDEFKLGSNDSFLKLAKDKSLAMKTLSSSSILNNDNQSVIVSKKKFRGYGAESETSYNNATNAGYSKEVFYAVSKKNYFKNKQDIIKDGEISSDIKDEIVNSNSILLDKFRTLIMSVSDLNDEIELGSLESIEKLDELKNHIHTHYTFSDYSDQLCIEKGSSKNNEAENSSFKITLYKNNEENSSLSFRKDGTIVLGCKDLIIERKDE